MDLERERGITIKAQSVIAISKASDGETYQLNLSTRRDTLTFLCGFPFVSRLRGALLVVDAGPYAEAQTRA